MDLHLPGVFTAEVSRPEGRNGLCNAAFILLRRVLPPEHLCIFCDIIK